MLRNCGGAFEPTGKGTTILHLAAKQGNASTARYLLHGCKGQRISVDAQKRNGMTPAMVAAQKGHLIILRMLKEAGADLSKTLDGAKHGGIDLLYIAAQSGHDVIVGYLLDKQIIKDGNCSFDKTE